MTYVPQLVEKGEVITDASGQATITFSTPFPSTPKLILQPEDLGGPGIVVDVVSISNTGATIQARKVTGNSTGSAGDHSHTASTGTAGGHSHTASTGSAGDHSHTASSGTAGAHQHQAHRMIGTGITYSGTIYRVYLRSGDGAQDVEVLTPYSGVDILYQNTDSAGDHSHTVSVGTGGAHTHSVTVDSAGGHTHTVSVGTSGSHSHSVDAGVAANVKIHYIAMLV